MAAVSKNGYFDVFDDMVNKYNNTVHRSIKMKAIDVTSDSYARYNEDSNKKSLNSKLLTVSGFQNTKKNLLTDILKIGRKMYLLVKLKIQFREHT